MHPIISETIKQIRNITTKEHSNIVNKISNLLNVNDYNYRNDLRVATTLLPFAESIGDALRPENVNFAFLFKNIGSVYYKTSQFRSAIIMYKTSEKIYKQFSGKHDDFYYNLKNNIAHNYSKGINFEKARVSLENVISEMEQNPDIPISHTNVAINNLCDVLQQIDFELMYTYLLKCIHSWRIIGIKNIDAAVTYALMGAYFYHKKNYNCAITNVKKAIKIILSINPDHLSLSSKYTDLATYYSELLSHRKALKYYNKSLDILKSYKQEHSYYGNILLYNIGYTFMLMENYKKSNDYYLEALFWQLKLYQENKYFNQRIIKYIHKNYEFMHSNERHTEYDFNIWLQQQLVDYGETLSDKKISENPP